MQILRSFAVLVLIAACLHAQPVLYGSEVSLDDLGSIDRTSGAWTLIGNQGISGSITGLAHDPGADVLYGCSPNNNSLYTLDQATGLATVIGPTGFSNINGLAWDSTTGALFCTDLNNNALFTIDTSTGSGTLVATMSNTSNVEGLAYDPATDTLYGLDDSAEQIVVINKSTGVAQPLPNTLNATGLWRGLTWDASLGVLWATLVNPGQLHMVDPNSGTSTLVGSTLTFVQGLAFKGGPEYQVNQPGASFDIDGIMGTSSAFAMVTLAVSQQGIASLTSTATGMPWDIATATAPPIPASAGAVTTSDGQLLNIDTTDPTFSLLWSGFQSTPFSNFSAPVSFPQALTQSFQMGVLDPASPSGIWLSQPVRLTVQ